MIIAPVESIQWDYILGNIYDGMSISQDRYNYLYDLNSEQPIKIALRDTSNNEWTKWLPFPGRLIEIKKDLWRINASIDVHRSMLDNEIVIESDYPTYEENYKANRIIGAVLESKGFVPHYYYSGSKSIHLHVFVDFDYFNNLDPLIIDQLKLKYNGSQKRFRTAFIKWLREKMISCWDTKSKEFDEGMTKDTHLIRCELSKNKLGHKTFLGYGYKDVSPIPYICNEENSIYPTLGKKILSKPHKINELMTEFIEDVESNTARKKIDKRNMSLTQWSDVKKDGLRNNVKRILSDEWKEMKDGFGRASWILLNELKNTFGVEQARIIINDWNNRMGNPVEQKEIDYRLKTKTYNLSSAYINKFIAEITQGQGL